MEPGRQQRVGEVALVLADEMPIVLVPRVEAGQEEFQPRPSDLAGRARRLGVEAVEARDGLDRPEPLRRARGDRATPEGATAGGG